MSIFSNQPFLPSVMLMPLILHRPLFPPITMLFDMIFNHCVVRLRTIPALLAGFVVLSSVAISQSQFWGPTNGPFGGTVKAVVFDAQGNLYAGTAGSGVFRSTDNGDTWTMINNGLDNHDISTDHRIWTLAARPGGDLVASVPGTVYHSTHRRPLSLHR